MSGYGRYYINPTDNIIYWINWIKNVDSEICVTQAVLGFYAHHSFKSFEHH